jgi:hypothetical protein
MRTAQVVGATVVVGVMLIGGGSAASSATPRLAPSRISVQHMRAELARNQRRPVVPPLLPGNSVVPGLLSGNPYVPPLPGNPLPYLPYLNSGCRGTPFRDSLSAPPILVQTCFVTP